MSVFMGLATGAVAYGANFGVEYIPVAPTWRSVIFGVGGLVGGVGLAKWGSPRLGAGFMGGVGALLTGRIVTQIRMAQVAPSSSTSSTTGASGLYGRKNPRAVYGRGAGAVFREGGAVYRESGAPVTTMMRPAFGPGFKEAGASRYVPAPVRFYGPHSWAYNGDAGAVRRVSAHNRSR